ncbi:FkbM family methyltransferase [Candidatus Chloroploca sp. M-50]|uniref:FkbM family methyltransferase n=1 Tax=Candidatus Chloroploca mongolica TaxID=2528176 RepID=A0ABS4D8G3_9CHLR|nr:FkbM family methyltransferase [Candidatus Chloroploca mongolica]MBP1465733.1 FkbM family methyltransferase [Candidatus Chloroploca mongolica]
MSRLSVFQVRTSFHGTEYGGWTICPDGLTASSLIYSFGVGEDTSFDLELIAQYGVEVHAFDPTPKSIAWVQSNSWPDRFHFHPIGIGSSDRMAFFFPPDDPSHVSHSILPRRNAASAPTQVQLFRLKTIADMLGHQQIDLLKMDIEGAEYEVITDLLDTHNIIIRQILIEFHPFFEGLTYNATANSIRQLEKRGYRLFNISNRGTEFSFIYL